MVTINIWVQGSNFSVKTTRLQTNTPIVTVHADQFHLPATMSLDVAARQGAAILHLERPHTPV